MSDLMLSIVKGVSRNRNISELGIGDEVCIYVNIFSSSCPLVGCTLWLLAGMYNHNFATCCFTVYLVPEGRLQ